MKDFKVEVIAKIEIDGDKQVISKKLGYNTYDNKLNDFVANIKKIINDFIAEEKENN